MDHTTGDRNVAIAVVISAVSFCALATYYWLKNAHSYWSRKGLKGPAPMLFAGNLLSILFNDRMVQEREWVRKYGKIYGTYIGLSPRLVIADPEVVLQISVKDFDKFQNHNLTEFSNKYQKSFLFFLKDDHWKKVRSLMSPTFTSGKIKRMFKLLDGCADDLAACFKEQLPVGQDSAIVNLKDTYNLFTMDAITTCCYGLKLERDGSTNLKTAATRNDFVRAAMKFFDFNLPRILLAVSIPKPILRLIDFKLAPDSVVQPLADRVTRLIEVRRKSTKKFDDYLQLLIDARIDAEMELDELDQQENHHAGLTHESLREDQSKMVSQVKNRVGTQRTNGNDIVLDDMEVLSGGIFLLAVGLETTGTLLTHCSFALAFHQDIQQRLYEELRAIGEYNEDKSKFTFNYDTLTSCKYLDAVISETLRLLSPVLQIDRVANAEARIEKYNIDIKQGDIINFAFHAIMNDPDYWEKPELFNPDRFMPENKDKIVPGAYCPFGLGPRHCIGMRFSLTESKLALAKIMMNYRFDPAPGTSFPPKTNTSVTLNNIKTPQVRIVPRK